MKQQITLTLDTDLIERIDKIGADNPGAAWSRSAAIEWCVRRALPGLEPEALQFRHISLNLGALYGLSAESLVQALGAYLRLPPQCRADIPVEARGVGHRCDNMSVRLPIKLHRRLVEVSRVLRVPMTWIARAAVLRHAPPTV